MHILLSSNDIIAFVFCTCPNGGGYSGTTTKIRRKKETTFEEFTVEELIFLQPSQISIERNCVWIFSLSIS